MDADYKIYIRGYEKDADVVWKEIFKEMDEAISAYEEPWIQDEWKINRTCFLSNMVFSSPTKRYIKEKDNYYVHRKLYCVHFTFHYFKDEYIKELLSRFDKVVGAEIFAQHEGGLTESKYCFPFDKENIVFKEASWDMTENPEEMDLDLFDESWLHLTKEQIQEIEKKGE